MRLFVAVVPPGPVLDAVAALPRPAVDGLRWTTREQWHVTLRFLGEVPDPGPVADALAGLAGGGPGPAAAEAGPAVGRFGRRVLHVPVTGLDELAGAVLARTAGLGRPPEDRPFRGHLTLARARGRGPGPDLRPLCGTEVSAAWTVTTVALVRSHLAPGGARYEELACFGVG